MLACPWEGAKGGSWVTIRGTQRPADHVTIRGTQRPADPGLMARKGEVVGSAASRKAKQGQWESVPGPGRVGCRGVGRRRRRMGSCRSKGSMGRVGWAGWWAGAWVTASHAVPQAHTKCAACCVLPPPRATVGGLGRQPRVLRDRRTGCGRGRGAAGSGCGRRGPGRPQAWHHGRAAHGPGRLCVSALCDTA